MFNDKTAIEADRTGGACDGNVYFSWSRFTGNGGERDLLLALDRPRRHVLAADEADASMHDVQFPDISVTGNGHVYVTFRQFDASRGQSTDASRSRSRPTAERRSRSRG